MAKFTEWEIKNFSCWSAEIHGECLSSDGIQLYPKGYGGLDERLVVRMYTFAYEAGSEMSFIGSDGSVIFTQAQQPDFYNGSDIVFYGPKFEEVVAAIRENEPVHKDRLVLRWGTPRARGITKFRTVIDACSAFFQLKPEVFDSAEHRENPIEADSNVWYFVHSFKFRFQDRNQSITLRACKTTGATLDDVKVRFKLKSYAEEKILARTSIWMQNGDNIKLKHRNDSILGRYDDHVLLFEIPLKQLPGLQTIMQCKMVTGQYSDNFCSTQFPVSHDLGITSFNSFPRQSQPENAVTALTNDLTSLCLGHDLSDFEVRCGTVSFPAHRAILSARSPVFRAMLSGGMREAVSGHMDVVEDPHTFDRFLAFLYSGSSGEDLGWEGALKLYCAADKYQVPSLKQKCTALLGASISLENVCDILWLADKHQDEALRSIIHDFILKNYNEVSRSENWERFMLSEPLLAVKTLTHFARNECVRKSDFN